MERRLSHYQTCQRHGRLQLRSFPQDDGQDILTYLGHLMGGFVPRYYRWGPHHDRRQPRQAHVWERYDREDA